MSPTQLYRISLTLLLGVFCGRIIGNLGFGVALSAVLLAGVCLLTWSRGQRRAEAAQRQQLVLLSALAEQAIRDGAVGSCYVCKRPVRASGRCLYCGPRRGDGPLR